MGQLTWATFSEALPICLKSCLPDVPARAGLATGWGWMEAVHHTTTSCLLSPNKGTFSLVSVPWSSASWEGSVCVAHWVMNDRQIEAMAGEECGSIREGFLGKGRGSLAQVFNPWLVNGTSCSYFRT